VAATTMMVLGMARSKQLTRPSRGNLAGCLAFGKVEGGEGLTSRKGMRKNCCYYLLGFAFSISLNKRTRNLGAVFHSPE
jgi:hypothetical protein